jgi:hypothetical protein
MAGDQPVSPGELAAEQLASELAESAAEWLQAADPLEVEILAGMLLGAVPMPAEVFPQILAAEIVPVLATAQRPEILALLLALGAIAPDPAGEAARTAARELIAAGVSEPAWAPELAGGVTVGDCFELSDSGRTGSILACTFHRGGRSHGVLVTVDHLDCGAADQASLLGGDDIQAALTQIVEQQATGLGLQTQQLEPALFRWKLEAAMDARVHHELDETLLVSDELLDDDADLAAEDLDVEDLDVAGFDEEDVFSADAFNEGEGPGYVVLAPLLRAWMRDLPEPPWPKPAHPGTGEESDEQDAEEGLFGLFSRMLAGSLAGDPALQAAADLPAARDVSSQCPAPIYRLKISLQGAKPPIWRRLELPGDASLEELHTIIQVAFNWHGGHLHAFETLYGDFGPGEAELDELTPEESVTLEQVAPAEGSTIDYRYDFGDNWNHQIRVEKLGEPDPAVSYPRCTGGRRAAPPEDCGGIGSYHDILETLADPADPEHAEALDWLGLGTAEEFDPAFFDKRGVTESLPPLLRA